jgi:tetratricopeptide (TPR) repeat protein
MSPDPQKIRELFVAALQTGDPAQWEGFLDQACRGDEELRCQVRDLLQAHREAGSFLDRPAAQEAFTGEYTPPPADPPPEAAPCSELLPGTMVGPYKLLQEIGEGGMGTVWMAQQTEPVKRLVALKVIKPGMDSRQVIARFEAERQALALMDHPHIARVLDAGTTATGQPYFVMELVKGVPLTRYCDEQRLTPRYRLELFVPVCQAIQHAHQKGVIHRDIKPSNVLIALYDGKPVPKVIDFGVAKATGQQLTERTLVTGFGAVVGTLEYMSPEQAELNQLDIDTRSDIYSLGVLLYELLTGSTPLERGRLKKTPLLEVLRLIREEEPPTPSTRLTTAEELPTIAASRGLEPRKLSGVMRGELDWIVMKCLEKDRGRRYETANGLALDIHRYLNDEPVQACPPSAWYRFRKFARRNKARLAVAACVFLVVAILVGSIGWIVRDRAAQATEKEREENARRAEAERRARASLSAARTLMAGNNLAAGRQKLAEARAQLGEDRLAPGRLAEEVEACLADLDRFQRFLELLDRAHEAETSSASELTLKVDGSRGSMAVLRGVARQERQPAKAVPFLLAALARYQVLERPDWSSTLERGFLTGEQAEQVRRSSYEELLWLADDIVRRQQGHPSGRKLSAEAAARQALVYLAKARAARRPTLAFYSLRARCRKILGKNAAARADARRAAKTPPTLALDHYLRGQEMFQSALRRRQAGPKAREKAMAIKAFEAALRLEPTHYWSLMRLGYCLCGLGQGREDFTGAARIFTGCILKRPNHGHAYFCRAHAYIKLRRYEEAVADNSRALELDPKHQPAWNGRGWTYFRMGRPALAVADLNKAIALDPEDPSAWANRGVTYIGLGQLHKALADYTRAIELDPKRAILWTNRGVAYCRLGQHHKALADDSKAVDLDPKYATAWRNRGGDYLNLGQLHKAVADYTRAIELDPEMAEAWHYRGNAHARLGQLQKAVADFSRAIDLDPKSAESWYNRGNAYLRLEQPDKAHADCSRAIALDRRHASAWIDRGVACLRLHQPDKALSDLNRALELNQKSAKVWENRGAAYFNLDQPDKALADYNKSIDLDATVANAWEGRGRTHLRLGQLTKAIADCTQAIKLDPKHILAWTHRGLAYARLGQLENALADCTRAIDLDSHSAQAWTNRGAAYLKLGRLDKAVADCSEAIHRDPRFALAWTNRGAAYLKLGRLDKAVADYSRAIKLNPKGATAWSGRGCAYLDLHQPTRALADCSQAIRLDAKDAAAWNGRGCAYLDLGQLTKALADFSKAIALNSKYALAWYNRGRAFARLDRQDEAIAAFRETIRLDPRSDGAHACLGLVLARKGKVDEAIAAYQKAIRLEPGVAMYHNDLGSVLCDHKHDYDGAIAAFRKAIRLQQDYVDAHVNLGNALANKGLENKAFAAYKEVIRLKPDAFEAYRHAVQLMITNKERKFGTAGEAVGLARKAVKLAPRQPGPWQALGWALYRTGDWKESIEAFQKSIALQKTPKGGDPWQWFGLAVSHWKMGNKEEGRKWYDRAVEWTEKNAQADWFLRCVQSEARDVLNPKKK